MRAHPRHREPAPRIDALGKIAPAAPFRIGHNRLSADFVEGDVLRRMARRGGDRQRREHPLRIARRPLQHLHAAHRAARHCKQRLDTELIEQHRLGAHHVAHGDHREFQAPRHPRYRIGRGRAGRAHAAADHVGANDEIAFGIDRLAGADHRLPPAGLAGDRMSVNYMLIAGECVTDQNGVAARGVERTIGLISDLHWREIDAGIEPQRIV